MRGVPVLASDSGYYPRSGMLPLAWSPGGSNLRPQLAEIMPAILWLQRMIWYYSIEPCRFTSKQNCEMTDHRLVANLAMATAVSGGLTATPPGDVFSSHRASELTGSGGCRTTTTPGSGLLKLIDPSCFPSSLRFAPSSFRLRLPVCDRFREPHDFT